MSSSLVTDYLTESQHLLISSLVRIGAATSILVTCRFIIWRILSHAYYRQRMFHRIMLGCAINTIVLNANMLWGPAAVPKGTPGFVGARGNTATCSAQGFFYVMGFVVPFYYCSLAGLCYMSIKNRFQIDKYQWIEKYIHVGVYLYPLVAACYLLSVQGFNPAIIDCYFVSSPLGCGDQSSTGETCVRGPDNYGVLGRWLLGAPLGIVLILPALVLGIMWFQVRRNPKGRQIAMTVAQQSLLYLLAIYWTYFFRFVFSVLTYKMEEYFFVAHVLASLVESMQGVWISLVYYMLRSDPISETDSIGFSENNQSSRRDSKHSKSNNVPSSNMESARSHPSSRRSNRSFDFCIFDGTGAVDPTSPWAQYLQDDTGEDEDYQMDCGEYDDTDFIKESSKPILVKPLHSSEEEENKDEPMEGGDDESSTGSMIHYDNDKTKNKKPSSSLVNTQQTQQSSRSFE